MLVLGLVIIFGLLFLGVPLFVCFVTGGSVLNTLYAGAPLANVAHMMFSALDSYVLMAVPFFILAGMLMGKGGLSRSLVDFIDSLIGHVPGGLGIVLIVSTMLFGAMTGSGTAAVAAIGIIIVPRMLELGYDKKFCLGLIAASAQLGVLIPPSIPMILFGSLTETPIADLFMAGLIPGIMIGVMLMIASGIICWRNKWGIHPSASWGERGRSFVKALPILFMPVLILGGIYTGTFTPTEASLIATLYAAVAGLATRTLSPKAIMEGGKDTLRTTGMIFLLVCSVIIFGRIMSYARIPHMLTSLVVGLDVSLPIFLLVIMVFYILIGFFAEVIIITYVTVPILFGVVCTVMGVHPYQYAVIMTTAVVLAATTPPVGVNLYLTSGLFKAPLEDVIKGVIPFMIVLLIGMIICTYVPALSTWLPSLMR
ncbi:MAG: TRAP transporter large permease [Chloroflexota bacterium]|nr:TRAP transporter large permease [Chloroflexota bacterium]